MSKVLSNHFHGTTGERNFPIIHQQSEENTINHRIRELDLREHPVKHKSVLSIKAIKEKVNNRTASKDDYKKYDTMRRLAKRRKKGVETFWKQERRRIKTGETTTRNWTAEQRNDILNNRIPKIGGKSLQGHHTYSVSSYPHLANKGEIIFPATFEEHLYYWHGGNFRNSLPGRPFKRNKKKGE
ncbi:MAG: hypothetical protein J6X33_07560 [Clostridiales bacterium]|nr:hypothetical protein [Clostridiales bacterium]